jgi:hypothetical protein
MTPIRISEYDLEKAIWWGSFAAISQWTEENPRDSNNIPRPSDRQLCAEIAEKGRWSPDNLLGFARRYSVQQVYINDNKDKKREERLLELANVISTIYTRKPEPTVETLATRWWEAVEAVQEVFLQKALDRGQKRGPLLRSFCMKTLWYYYPEIATMWDSFAVKGLNLIEGTRHKTNIKEVNEATDFLKDFEALFIKLEGKIDQALAVAQGATGVAYPYKRRVLDKALWYIGVPTDEKQEEAWDLEILRLPEIVKATAEVYDFAAWAGLKVLKD